MKAIRIILSIILAFGGMLVFNENPETFTPNFIGLACLALLVVVNIDKETIEKIQNK